MRFLGRELLMYHIFVDFEMTCGFNRSLINEAPMTEIIEIGAAKLNESYEVIETFSLIVKPQYCSSLSRKCVKLTGIYDADIVNAPYLDEALILFEDWLGTENVKFYSWSDNDKRQLEKECLAKGLYSKMPSYYRRWLDFQSIFMRVYGFERHISLMNAIDMMGISFEGKQHKAVYDALNSAKLLTLMKNKEIHKTKLELFGQIHNDKTITSSIGDLFGNKLSKLVVAS